ncbi:hypothetical protein F442_11849 [Phytophthora nicotianae P10297]|uniref:Uncharacterized protein n=3 Tax=Phytophthora nicotianae TaxID=4792 RepID=W2Q292_PHYN3|nr:hypothetical protein PPTG_23338 [Phytophthora nicotianae INRA-310]ETI43038.1 hypothetical protein F443_11932 [Phytophthora nicotianae P1569]ETN06689.1 hypothetical protein PPTG_23338 [Phytophthora nicotianae INRA-310]ETP40882.1 hypothetical protein F442_11849 [Phytophthora nicotianae P10297]
MTQDHRGFMKVELSGPDYIAVYVDDLLIIARISAHLGAKATSGSVAPNP